MRDYIQHGLCLGCDIDKREDLTILKCFSVTSIITLITIKIILKNLKKINFMA